MALRHSMKSIYQKWDWQYVPNACELDQLVGVDRVYRLSSGTEMLSGWPVEAAFHMDPDLPNDTLLIDNVRNVEEKIVVSERLKTFLEAQSLVSVEYLPVTIINHKGKPADESYFIVHPLGVVDCLDLDACEITWSRIDPKQIRRLKRLVIEEPSLTAGRMLFRIKGLAGVILVHRDLAKAIDRQEFSGVSWKELEDYPRPRSDGP
jgi:uncharacterized protein DUF1629